LISLYPLVISIDRDLEVVLKNKYKIKIHNSDLLNNENRLFAGFVFNLILN